MPTDIYTPDSWNSFFMMIGGGVAALVGLIFVALSLRLDGMTKDATHKYRSINTLAGLTAVFVGCGLVLMPGQNHWEVGLELLLIAITGTIIFLFGFHQAFKFGSHPSKVRLILGTCLYIGQLAGALVLMSGSLTGLYVAAASIVLNVAFMISAAWLLVVGVYNA